MRLRASDVEGDVREVRYSVDGGDEIITAETSVDVSLTQDGVPQIEYRAVDTARNYEATKTIEVEVDATAPTATMITANPTVFVDPVRPVLLQANATDATSGVASVCFQVTDMVGANSSGCQQAVRAANGIWSASPDLPLGLYHVSARATDVAGNTGEASAASMIIVVGA